MTVELRSNAKDAVAAALTFERSEDLIAGVRSAVIQELQSLDAAVRIKETQYFNHTFAPDLELTWPDDRRASRYVYLRYSLESAAAGRDFQSLAPLSPVVLALREEEPAGLDLARDEFDRVNNDAGLLATDVGALGALGVGSEPGTAPLLALVRGNVVRGARGLLVADRVQDLANQALGTETGDQEEQAAQLAGLEALVNDVFLPAASTRLLRAVQLVRAASSDDFLATADGTNAEQVGGRLSHAELRVLLPYFLRPDAAPRSTAFWQYLGSLTDLAGLEGMSTSLLTSDLTPFVTANAASWQARRAQAVLNADALDELESDDPAEADGAEDGLPGHVEGEAVTTALDSGGEVPSQPGDTMVVLDELDAAGGWVADGAGDAAAGEASTGAGGVRTGALYPWQMLGGRLCLTAGRWRVLFTTDRRALSGRVDSAPARWDELAGQLTGFDLTHVQLDGASRRLGVTAESAADVYRDVAVIRDRIQDQFHVPVVIVKGRREDAAAVRADFTTMLAEPVRGTASVQELAEVALTVLAHRTPATAADFRAVGLVPVAEVVSNEASNQAAGDAEPVAAEGATDTTDRG